MNKVTVNPSDEIMESLYKEKATRRLPSVSDTAMAILGEYFKKLKFKNKVNGQGKKSIMRAVRENRGIRYFVFLVYALIIVAVFINLANIQYPILNYLNATYSTVNTPSDFKFFQTYPPSVNGIEVGDANQTIILQIRIHSDTKIMENTPVTLEVEGGEGSLYAENVSDINVGFFGAQYYGHPTTLNGYDLWTGFAGVDLNQNSALESLLIFLPQGGVQLGAPNATVFWSNAGDKPLSMGLIWKYAPAGHFIYTYDYSTVHVYSSDDIRATRISYAEVIAVFGALLFGVLDVYPNIKGRKTD